ncbi:MAG: hypothetical protein JKX80_00175 [Candidatus Pacebacteria bacterium]|nr:hypothetical protein [Candidatus Paceibacterota bacterium]
MKRSSIFLALSFFVLFILPSIGREVFASAAVQQPCGVLIKLGDTSAAVGKNARAITIYTQVLGMCPASALARFQRARVYMATGMFALAGNDFKKVTKSKPHWQKAWSGLAWSLYKHGHPKSALPAVRRALQLKPADFRVLHTLGKVLQALDAPIYDYVKAYRAAWRLDPKRKKGWTELMTIVDGIPYWGSMA